MGMTGTDCQIWHLSKDGKCVLTNAAKKCRKKLVRTLDIRCSEGRVLHRVITRLNSVW